MANDKFLFVVSGAAGTGKDSVVKALREAHPEIEKTVSATTRTPRPGEQEGVDYYYRTREQFRHLIETDQVVEHNFYNGNYYGTLREEVDKRLAARKVVVLVIDVHGAANIRRMFPGATTVFLLPPSVEELERRLRGRGTETEDSIQERLATARHFWLEKSAVFCIPGHQNFGPSHGRVPTPEKGLPSYSHAMFSVLRLSLLFLVWRPSQK